LYSPGVKANVLLFDKMPGREEHWTRELWVYDLKTNQHFTLKKNPLRRHHLDEFVELYNSEDLHERQPTYSEEAPEGRWRRYSYEEIMRREGANLDLSWIRDKSLEDSADLEDPDVIAEEIADDLQAALEQFATIATDLRPRG
jgi:type I restriction enzyme M protein